MKIIERTDAEALSWPVGSVQYVGDQPWIVHMKVRGPEPRVELVERDEWFLATCMLTPFVSFKIGEREIRAEVGTSPAEFLALIRRMMLAEIMGKRDGNGK